MMPVACAKAACVSFVQQSYTATLSGMNLRALIHAVTQEIMFLYFGVTVLNDFAEGENEIRQRNAIGSQ